MKEHKFKHLMVDIETMGTESFSSIISIGAVEFDIETGDTGADFHQYIDLQSCIDEGLIINANTVKWWLQQSSEARNKISGTFGLPLKLVLSNFAAFCAGKDYQIWGNSARFDLGILQDAYNKLNIPIPWDFKKERCVRTLVSFNESIKQNMKFEGTRHDAIADCYFQIKYCTAIWKEVLNIDIHV